jgi:hypothetical protein
MVFLQNIYLHQTKALWRKQFPDNQTYNLRKERTLNLMAHVVHLFSITLQLHSVNTPQFIPAIAFYKFTLVKVHAIYSSEHGVSL